MDMTGQQTTSHQTVSLGRGRHRDPTAGACVMELASMLAGEPFSDRPATASPVIAALLRCFNDAVRSGRRQRLYPLAALVVGTCGEGDLERRRLDRCLQVAAEVRALRPVRCLLKPVPSADDGTPLDVIAWRVVRILRSAGDMGEARTVALVEELAAMGRRPQPATSLRTWAELQRG